MIATLSFFVLCALTMVLAALPFVPAIVEARRKTDATPLSIALDHDGNIRHFARRFRDYLQAQLSGSKTEGFAGDLSLMGHLQDGTPFVKAKGDVDPVLPPYGEEERLSQRILIASASLSLPDRTAFTQEVYAVEPLFGGTGDIYRAVLGEKDIFLARGSMVLRWLHTEGKVQVARESVLYGRTSSEQLIRLAETCRFERLNAPCIEFGTIAPAPAAEDAPHVGEVAPASPSANAAPEPGATLSQPWGPPATADVAGRRWRVRGDVAIPAGSRFDGDLVVTGRLHVGAGTQITGSLKTHQAMHLDDRTHVTGSVVSARGLTLGAGCRITGPVVAEQEITIHPGVLLGTAAQPTTVSAPHIRVASGVVAHGTVWARDGGEVVGGEGVLPGTPAGTHHSRGEP
jgi:cytoskeletal protein CcmA (bactofilin family)